MSVILLNIFFRRVLALIATGFDLRTNASQAKSPVVQYWNSWISACARHRPWARKFLKIIKLPYHTNSE
jgi:hypothetical protein